MEKELLRLEVILIPRRRMARDQVLTTRLFKSNLDLRKVQEANTKEKTLTLL